MKKILILGGGAAGLAAALHAAQSGAQVTLAERDERVGQKLLRTGNGRCNFTNLHVSESAYNHPSFVRPVLEKWDAEAMRAFFSELGLLSYEDPAGRVYPRSDTAASVLDVLRLACRRYGVETVTGFDAARLDGANVQARDGRTLSGDAILVATGGGTQLLKSAGHRIVPFSPVLCPLKTDTAPIRGLSGIRVHGVNFLLTVRDHLVHRIEQELPRDKEDGQSVQKHKQRRPEINADKTFKLTHFVSLLSS